MGSFLEVLPAAIFSLFASAAVIFLFIEVKWPWVWLDFQHLKKFIKLGVLFQKLISKKHFVVDLFEDKVKEQPKKPMVIFQDNVYTYEFMGKQANRVAHVAQKIGLKKGDIVAMMMFNEPAFIWTYLGFLKIGVQPAFINFNVRSRSLAHCLGVSESKMLFVGQGDELVKAVEEIQTDLKDHGIVIYAQGADSSQLPAGFHTFDDLMAEASDADVSRTCRQDVTSLDPLCYIYTSGTTGMPKPAIVTHAKGLKAAFLMNLVDVTADDILYTALPLYHSAAGLIALGNTIHKGATLVLRSKFSVTHFWEDCRKHKVTVIQYIGELCRYLLSKPPHPDDSNNNVRVAFGNGLRSDIWKEFTKRFNIPVIGEFYAATEGNGGFANVHNKFGSVGRHSPIIGLLYPCAFIKFDLTKEEPVRDNNGRCIHIKPGETGLFICKIKRDFEFDGYKAKNDMNEKKILRNVFKKGDKWFNSGDLLSIDDQYFVYFKDRIGDTFRWKGENVSTIEVANVVADLSFIEDANVYGVEVPGQDGRAGMAAITLKSGEKLTGSYLGDIYHHCEDLLPVYARPKFLRLQSELEITSTFKQRKVELVKEGFDLEKVKGDQIYIVDAKNKTYIPMTSELFKKVQEGLIHL